MKNLKELLPQLKEPETQNNKSNIVKKKLTIKFITSDQHIDHSLSCFNTDIFSDIEDELYNNYPELKFRNNVFLCGGKVLERMKTLEENEVKDGDKILISDL